MVTRFASGVPKVSAPDLRFMVEWKLPRIAGHPGRTSWARAMPAIPSASVCATTAALETVPIAPPKMPGETATHWFAAA